MIMKRLLLGALAVAVLMAGGVSCFATPTEDEMREMIQPYSYRCVSLDGNDIIGEQVRYDSNNVDSAYSVYIVYDMAGKVIVSLGEKTWAELGWDGYVRPTTFRDVAVMYGEGSHWARADIWTLAAYGVASGYPGGYFYPDRTITRGEYLKLIATIARGKYAPPQDLTLGFHDVNADDWYAGYVAWAAGNKMIHGYADGNFYPNREITREEMAVIADNAITALGLTFPRAQTVDTVAFVDGSEISQWATAAVAHMSRLQLINGDESNRFSPKQQATRAEAITVIGHMYYEMYEPDDRWIP